MTDARYIVRADARAIPLADESVQCVVTSPPYWGLRAYDVEGDQLGMEKSPEDYIARILEVFVEVRRVLKPDGTLWLNIGDTFWSQGGAGGTMSQSGNVGGGKRQQPRPEAVNPGAFGRWNRSNQSGIKPKDLVGIPWMMAFALRSAGWWLRSDIIWAKPNPMPESVTDRPTRSHEYLFLLTKSETYYYDAEAIFEPCVSAEEARYDNGENGMHSGESHAGTGSSTRKFRGSGNKERKYREDFGGPKDIPKHQAFGIPWEGGPLRNKRDVWTVGTRPYAEAHYATFPADLIEPCILAGSRRGDFILDPFAGSGTTAMVADIHGRKGISIDLGYQQLQLKRLKNIQPVLEGVIG